MRNFLIILITFYQKTLRVFLKPSCKFYPSCSEYTKSAIEKYGARKGSLLGIKRIFKCHPWATNKIDKLE